MKSDKKLRLIFDKAKYDRDYHYTFEDFKNDARNFLKDVRNQNTVCSMKVSRSGMTRRFNFDKYNMFLNICYCGKMNWDEVKVGGCGMDMHWHLKFYACESVATKKEQEKWFLNSHCGYGKVL